MKTELSGHEKIAMELEEENPLMDGSAYYNYLKSVDEDDSYEDYKCDNDQFFFSELFGFALMEAARVYAVHREAKGDSWQDMASCELRQLLHESICEWGRSKPDSTEEYNELLDIVNQVLMLVECLAVNTKGKVLESVDEMGQWGKEQDRRRWGSLGIGQNLPDEEIEEDKEPHGIDRTDNDWWHGISHNAKRISADAKTKTTYINKSCRQCDEEVQTMNDGGPMNDIEPDTGYASRPVGIAISMKGDFVEQIEKLALLATKAECTVKLGCWMRSSIGEDKRIDAIGMALVASAMALKNLNRKLAGLPDEG